MLAICKARFGAAIPPQDRYLGELDQTDYSFLQEGEAYEVYGLIFICNRVDYLVCPPGNLPSWVPNSLFDLADARMPAGWAFCATRTSAGYQELYETFGVSYIVGYPLLINDYSHYVGLLEREQQHIRLFFDHKIAIDSLSGN